MAGHSKWANIKHKKAKQDAKRGKAFTKLIREITVAARLGGDDPAMNARLRAAIDKALAANMPKDTISKAAKRGAGGLEGQTLEEITYEGYGVGGVAVLVNCMTDNRNRTVADVRHAFTKCGGSLGTSGSVAYLFNKQGEINYPPGSDEDAIMEAALEAGAVDVLVNDDHSIDVITEPDKFSDVYEYMQDKEFKADSAGINMTATTEVNISNQEDADKIIKVVDMLEDLDDVQEVFSNADIPAEFL